MSSSLSDVCGSSSRDGVAGSVAGGVNNGDWICGDVTCHHSNFARRQQCNKCQRDRSLERSSSVGSSGSNKKKLGTEIGKAAAEKSRGLFSAEDWQCNKCANVNWARRMTCNMCNAPKFCDVEERTGFGGGYNDRGVVEYKEREESDSEYDEFGRLKKPKKGYNNDESRIKNNLSREKSTVEEVDEDDEEDDDDDNLAKYNLFSDDEEVLPSVKSQNPKVKDDNLKNTLIRSSNEIVKSNNRRSRSRTRSDIRRRQSFASSRASSISSSTSSSSSSSTTSSSSSSSSSSATSSSQQSRSLEKESRFKKHSYSRSRSHSPRSLSTRRRSSSRDDNTKKRSHDKSKLNTTERHRGYSSKSRSKSHSSNHSSRSPPNKRNRNTSSARKHSRSPHSHRKRTTRSRSKTPKRRR